MFEHFLKQGTPEWLTLRQNHFTASEAPAMMGDSPFSSREQLMYEKATGIRPEVSSFLQSRFDQGHAAEEAALPLVEAMAGQPLFPVTGTLEVKGIPLLASFDGIDLEHTLVFEHKLLNPKVVAMIERGILTPLYYWQLEQQLLVSGAKKALFVCSDGTPANFHHMEYFVQPERREALIKGWKTFIEELAHYREGLKDGSVQPPVIEEVIRDDAAFMEAEQAYLEAFTLQKEAEAALKKAKQSLVELSDNKKSKGHLLKVYPVNNTGRINYKEALTELHPDTPMDSLEKYKGKSYTSWTVKPL